MLELVYFFFSHREIFEILALISILGASWPLYLELLYYDLVTNKLLKCQSSTGTCNSSCVEIVNLALTPSNSEISVSASDHSMSKCNFYFSRVLGKKRNLDVISSQMESLPFTLLVIYILFAFSSKIMDFIWVALFNKGYLTLTGKIFFSLSFCFYLYVITTFFFAILYWIFKLFLCRFYLLRK